MVGSIISNLFLLIIALSSLFLININSLNSFWILNLAILLFVVALFLSLVFLNQFVFPLYNGEQRFLSILSLFKFLIGILTKVLIVRDGMAVTPTENTSKNSGIAIWLDSASAAVIINQFGEHRVLGKGFWFLNHNERILDIVSLKKKTQTLGPLPGEIPFRPKMIDETSESYDFRRRRTGETLALTRDGCEICATISCEYQIDNSKGKEQGGFLMDTAAVWKAIKYSKSPIGSSRSKNSNSTDWTLLPGIFAVKVWKEIASQLSLAEIMEINGNNSSTITLINEQIQMRLTRATYQTGAVENEGKTKRFPSPEFRALQACGIRVLNVTVSKINIPDFFAAKLHEGWRERKIQEGETIAKEMAEYLNALDREARRQALLDFSSALARFSSNPQDGRIISNTDLLSANLKGILYLIRHDALLAQSLEKDYQQLTNLNDFIIRTRSETNE